MRQAILYQWNGEAKTIQEIANRLGVHKTTARRYVTTRRYQKDSDVPYTAVGRPNKASYPDRAVSVWHEGDLAYYLKWSHGNGRNYKLSKVEAVVKQTLLRRIRIEWKDKRGVVYTRTVAPNRLERRQA